MEGLRDWGIKEFGGLGDWGLGDWGIGGSLNGRSGYRGIGELKLLEIDMGIWGFPLGPAQPGFLVWFRNILKYSYIR